MPTDLDKWRTKQVNAAVARGLNVLDAQNAVDTFLALLPSGADPDTYIVPSYQLEQQLPSVAILADARAAWYGDEDIQPRFKRILDAKGVE